MDQKLLFLLLLPNLVATDPNAGCDGLERPSFIDLNIWYNQSAVGRKYPHGTTAEAYCDYNVAIVEGNCRTVCTNGKWVPELGRCPFRCDIEDLTKKKGYFTCKPETRLDVKSNGRPHGSAAIATCANGMQYVNIRHDRWLCNDGLWKPFKPEFSTCYKLSNEQQ